MNHRRSGWSALVSTGAAVLVLLSGSLATAAAQSRGAWAGSGAHPGGGQSWGAKPGTAKGRGGYPDIQRFHAKPYITAPQGGARYFSPYALTPYGSTIVFAGPSVTYFVPARPVFAPALPPPSRYGSATPLAGGAPGYWSWQWVPRVYTYQVWTPGPSADGGAWAAGRYEPRTIDNGFYQKVWVGGPRAGDAP